MARQIVVVAVIVLGAASLFAQTQLTGDALLQALLTELRTLRTTLQRNSAFEIRGKLLIDRARLHQENIRELSRELEGSAEFMTRQPMEVDPTWENEAAMVEANVDSRVAGIADPEERKKMLERHRKTMEQRKAMEIRHREQMRMRYERMEARLAEERDKLKAIEEELAEMQTELMR